MLHFEGLLRITAHTQTSGSKTACVYPERFAACRVSLRAQAKPSTKWRVATYDFIEIMLSQPSLAERRINNDLTEILSPFARSFRNARFLPSLHTHFVFSRLPRPCGLGA